MIRATSFPEENMTISSAYTIVEHCFVTFGRSFTSNTNSNGPRIELCGTPDVIRTCSGQKRRFGNAQTEIAPPNSS